MAYTSIRSNWDFMNGSRTKKKNNSGVDRVKRQGKILFIQPSFQKRLNSKGTTFSKAHDFNFPL